MRRWAFSTTLCTLMLLFGSVSVRQNSYVVTWDSTTVSDGLHTVRAIATDAAGNAAADERTIIVDNHAPVLTVTIAANALLNQPTPIRIEAFDAVGIVGGSLQVGTLGPVSISFPYASSITATKPGRFAIVASAWDAAGHTTSQRVSVLVKRR